jgi:hypothetical protein
MYLKVNNKKIEIKEYNKFSERFKSFKFYLEKIDYGIKIPNKRRASTYFFCQRVDICFTDKDDKILYLYKDIKSEKKIFKFKAKNIYYLPLDTCKYLKVGEKLNIIKKSS